MPADGVISLDNVALVPRSFFLGRITKLTAAKMDETCRALNVALGC